MLALLLFAQVAVHVEDARGLEDTDRDQLLQVFGESIKELVGSQPVISRDPCTSAEKCQEEVKKKTGAREVVHLRLIGVPSRIRVVAERESERGGPMRRAQADLTREQSSWRGSLDGVALVLFPSGDRPPPIAAAPKDPTPPIEQTITANPIVDPIAPPPEDEGPNYLPWVAFGGSAVALGLGAFFGVRANNARSDGETNPHTTQEVSELQDSAYNNGLAANVLFGVAAVGVVAGVMTLVGTPW